jgi:hypothetical protein
MTSVSGVRWDNDVWVPLIRDVLPKDWPRVVVCTVRPDIMVWKCYVYHTFRVRGSCMKNERLLPLLLDKGVQVYRYNRSNDCDYSHH